MSAVDRPIVTMVTRKVYLRPTRSPMRPNTIAPSGRTPKPGAEGGQAGQQRRALVAGREEQLAEEHGQRAVEVEVVPLEQRAQARGQDDAADGGGGGGLAGNRLRGGHWPENLPYRGADRQPAAPALRVRRARRRTRPATASPTSAVEAWPADVARAQPPVLEHVARPRPGWPPPPRVSPSQASIMAAERMAPTGLAMPRPAMSGAEPCTGSNIDGCRRVGSRFALGARPRPPVTVAVISEQDVAEEVRGHDHVEAPGAADQLHGRGVDQDRRGLDLRELRRHLAEDAVPERHAVALGVGLRDGGDGAPLQRARLLEGEADDALGAAAGEDRGLHRDLGLGAAVDGPPDLRVFALRVLAHEDDVDGLLLLGQRAWPRRGKRTVGRTLAYCSKARRMGRSRPLSVVWSCTFGWPTAPR